MYAAATACMHFVKVPLPDTTTTTYHPPLQAQCNNDSFIHHSLIHLPFIIIIMQSTPI
jgi:hypothetical protein